MSTQIHGKFLKPLIFTYTQIQGCYNFTPSRLLPPPEKTPKAMADKGKKPLKENSFPSKKQTI
jgi:hypothetical protein